MEKRTHIRKVAIVCCSDGLGRTALDETERLCRMLSRKGIAWEISPCLAASHALAAASPEKRAGILHGYYRDPSIDAIWDVSGGNLANQVLEFLDYSLIGSMGKPFWGYSDLTVLLNAIWTMTGNSGWLFPVRMLVGAYQQEQIQRLERWNFGEETAMFPDRWDFCNGDGMEGILLGGNLRCFLKLAGTRYFPDLRGKLLFLESLGGGVGVIASLLTQLKQIGVFDQIGGLLLGTFTQMENEGMTDIPELVKNVADTSGLPIARTTQAGHGADSRGLLLGKSIRLEK